MAHILPPVPVVPMWHGFGEVIAYVGPADVPQSEWTPVPFVPREVCRNTLREALAARPARIDKRAAERERVKARRAELAERVARFIGF